MHDEQIAASRYQYLRSHLATSRFRATMSGYCNAANKRKGQQRTASHSKEKWRSRVLGSAKPLAVSTVPDLQTVNTFVDPGRRVIEDSRSSSGRCRAGTSGPYQKSIALAFAPAMVHIQWEEDLAEH